MLAGFTERIVHRSTIVLTIITWNLIFCKSSMFDECESTRKLLRETNILLNQIVDQKSSCLITAFEDVTSFKDSLDKVIDLLKSTSGASSMLSFCPGRPRDCHDVKLAGSLRSGRYVVFPDEDFDPFYVFCDMDTDGGGWTVFQRREDGSANFFRTWIEYHYGFGQLSGEHWLGNSKLHRLTSQRPYELRVDLEDFEGEKSYASYDHFAVEDERDGYRLSLRGFNGTAGDSLSYHHGQPFSTRDRDGDASNGNCAKLYSGAWWYQRCHFSNLNGKYYEGGKISSKGTAWYHWKNAYYSVKRSEMKIRPSPGN